MTSDLDSYRTASVLISEHGDEADLEAAQRADPMLKKDQTSAYLISNRVLAAVKAFQRKEPLESEVVNRGPRFQPGLSFTQL